MASHHQDQQSQSHCAQTYILLFIFSVKSFCNKLKYVKLTRLRVRKCIESWNRIVRLKMKSWVHDILLHWRVFVYDCKNKPWCQLKVMSSGKTYRGRPGGKSHAEEWYWNADCRQQFSAVSYPDTDDIRQACWENQRLKSIFSTAVWLKEAAGKKVTAFVLLPLLQHRTVIAASSTC